MSDPYASHIEFLKTQGGEASRVLELGSGLHSTPLFLNREFFPHVIEVRSVEHIQVWADRVAEICQGDTRLNLVVVPEPIEDYLRTIDLEDFDLIFVDNSECWQNRVKTIEYLGEHVVTSEVIIHDFEHKFYQDAARAFTSKIVDTTQTPHTAAMWKNFQ